MEVDNIDAKLQTIQNYYNYLGSILSKGYNNDINELNNIIDKINEDDVSITHETDSEDQNDISLLTKQKYYNYKKKENSLFSLDSSEEENDVDEKSESEKSESESEDDNESRVSLYDNESRVSLYDRFFGKNTSNPSNENTDKVEIFCNKSIDIEKILLYKSTTEYIKKLKHYMKLIKNY